MHCCSLVANWKSYLWILEILVFARGGLVVLEHLLGVGGVHGPAHVGYALGNFVLL